MSSKRERRTKSQDERLVGFWNSIDAPARARALRVLAAMEGYELRSLGLPTVELVDVGGWNARTVGRVLADEGPADWNLPDMPAPK